MKEQNIAGIFAYDKSTQELTRGKPEGIKWWIIYLEFCMDAAIKQNSQNNSIFHLAYHFREH